MSAQAPTPRGSTCSSRRGSSSSRKSSGDRKPSDGQTTPLSRDSAASHSSSSRNSADVACLPTPTDLADLEAILEASSRRTRIQSNTSGNASQDQDGSSRGPDWDGPTLTVRVGDSDSDDSSSCMPAHAPSMGSNARASEPGRVRFEAGCPCGGSRGAGAGSSIASTMQLDRSELRSADGGLPKKQRTKDGPLMRMLSKGAFVSWSPGRRGRSSERPCSSSEGLERSQLERSFKPGNSPEWLEKLASPEPGR